MPSRIESRQRPARARVRLPRALVGVAAALLLAGAGAGLAQSPEAGAELVASSVPCLNLRPGPSLEDAPVRCLPPGRRMTLLESRGEWGKVRLPDDQVGWVALELLQPLAEGAPALVPPAPRREPPPRPEPPPSEAPRQPEPAPESQAAPRPEPPGEPGPAPEQEPPKGEGEETAARERVRELEAALATAAAEREELERAFAAVITEEAEAKARAEEAGKLSEEVDDLTGLLRAAEMFLSESERQRLDLARQVAVLQEENRALRERLGLEPESGAGAPVAEAGEDAVEGEGDAPASGVLLPAAPLDETAEPVAAPEVDPGAGRGVLAEIPAAEDTGASAEPASQPDASAIALPESLVAEGGGTAGEPAPDSAASAAVLPEAAVGGDSAPAAGSEADVAPAAAHEPAAGKSPPTPGPEPEPKPETSELMKTVTAWAKAWSEQRVEDYLAFYAAGFQPPGGLSRAAWEAQRRQRISAPSRIEVKVALRDVRTQSPTEVEIELLQSYSSNIYSDVVVKTLELVLEAGAWKIARETS